MARPRKNQEILTEAVNVRFTPEQMSAFREAMPGIRQGGTADIIRDLVLKAVSVAPGVREGTITPEEAAQAFESFFRGIAVTQVNPEVKPDENNTPGKGDKHG